MVEWVGAGAVHTMKTLIYNQLRLASCHNYRSSRTEVLCKKRCANGVQNFLDHLFNRTPQVVASASCHLIKYDLVIQKVSKVKIAYSYSMEEDLCLLELSAVS